MHENLQDLVQAVKEAQIRSSRRHQEAFDRRAVAGKLERIAAETAERAALALKMLEKQSKVVPFTFGLSVEEITLEAISAADKARKALAAANRSEQSAAEASERLLQAFEELGSALRFSSADKKAI